VVEYSELTPEQAEAREPDGRLRFGAGNIAIHAIRRDFTARVAETADLPFHCARKVVPHLDEGGEPVEPAEPNAVKFERFVFDALPLAGRSVTMEVKREEEFSPLKNATGVDSVETARADLTALFLRWYESAGLEAEALARSRSEIALEIDPVVALDGIEQRLPDGGASS
jgi:UDP-N-acetylglucosamine/UDP-N-acetylgalactosamine diphosphorylase